MDEEKKALSCPFCGGGSHHILGARQIRMPDVVNCLDCFAEIQGTYEPESALIKWNTRAQLPSQEGEAVEVVAYRYTSGQRLGGKWHYQESFPKWDDRKVREIGQMDELMTVAQHNRIVADVRANRDAVLKVMRAKEMLTKCDAATPSPDAELVELLRECRNDFAGVSMSHTLIQRIDAKLASLEVK